MFTVTSKMATTIVPENMAVVSNMSSDFLSSDFTTSDTLDATSVSVNSIMTTTAMMETTTQGDGRNFRFEDPVQRIIIGCVYCLVAVVGFAGNFMVILAVILSRKLQTRTNAFVVNLAVADLVTCSTILFTALALFSMNGWPLPGLPLIVCSVAAGLFYTSLGCSIINLALIAINRFVLITKSSRTYRSVYTPKKIAAMLVFTWGYPALVCCFPLFGIGKWGYSEKYKACGQDNSHETSDLFSLLGSLLVYPIPLIILFVCYFKIYRHITGHMKKLSGKGVELADTSNLSSASTKRLPRNQPASFSKRQVEITKNLFYVVCAFVACLAPFAISLMIPPSDPAIPWTGMITIFNSAINPIIYGAKHPHFKEVFRHMLRYRYHMIPERSGCLRKIRSR
ncbi:alpha-1D adrenergic receptor-like [Patiria miniata]|uniref:G-protein coupled receptors family 1 profile domain-containing protein n=1 Tax=Patiria miniata TaxID=46514 RepID=A0A914BBB2_PATMI|nr:alpha-1D adrenergic receptor-like [Patiria miniata]